MLLIVIIRNNLLFMDRQLITSEFETLSDCDKPLLSFYIARIELDSRILPSSSIQRCFGKLSDLLFLLF